MGSSIRIVGHFAVFDRIVDWPKRKQWSLVGATRLDRNGFPQIALGLFLAVSTVAGATVMQAHLDPVLRQLPAIEGKGIRFTRISTENGLSQPRVAQIVQDDLGFMWFGTQYGLNRYDGYKFKLFKHEPGNPSSLSSVYVYALFKDRSGSLWPAAISIWIKFDPVT